MKYFAFIAMLVASSSAVRIVDPIYRPDHVKTAAQKYNAAAVAGAEAATATKT